jgi:predicted membrane-bound spermidine synthase
MTEHNLFRPSLNKYRLLFFLFVISGFAGLIYESIWSHYLKLFLGHAAYSQALVLTIFMGGMAIGAWLAGKLLFRNLNLLYAYALVEMLIGIMGMFFHDIFQWVMDTSFMNVIPALAEPGIVQLYKWTLGGILILPQSILLGATFPLMTNGLLRMRPELPGRSISLLYFANSIGAAVGVLVAGFYLIARVGMPGTILTAGIINILIAVAVYLIAKGQVTTAINGKPDTVTSIPQLILWASFLTGTASFIYELVWIRMLSMVLGASTHAFELMLSAFITGLAFGGLWIRNRVDRLDSPLRFAAVVQILMGLVALSTLVLYNHTFDLMGFLIRALNTNEDSYFLFNLGSHFIALIVMLPATFLAGMTLPLFTLILLKNNYGEQSISHIYVSNMLGAISGIMFVIFFGMPVLGLKGSMLAGSGIDMVLGFTLLLYAGKGQRRTAMIILSSCVFLFIALIAELDPKHMSSSVFRHGQPTQPDDTRVISHRDGKTSTVTVLKDKNNVQILYTNGKPDASVYMGKSVQDNPNGDEITQVLLGAIPLAINPDARKVANIGMGSGMTSHTVLLWPGIEQLDTVEIEAEMIAAAQEFRPKTELVFTDPRSFIHVEDARTFFSLSKEKYDLIISEPSNPWVSGVSSLYTREFYQRIKKSLKHDGYLVQWLHLYEINSTLVFSVLKALSENFSDYRIYATNNFDVVIIARAEDPVEKPGKEIFELDGMRNELSLQRINSLQDIEARYLANRWLLEPLLASQGILPNSDYFPLLDIFAPKARFMHESVTLLLDLKRSPVPVTRYLLRPEVFSDTRVSLFNEYIYTKYALHARKIMKQISREERQHVDDGSDATLTIEYMRNAARQCTAAWEVNLWIRQFFVLVKDNMPYLSRTEMATLLAHIRPDCPAGLPEAQQLWLELISAVNTEDHEQIINLTRRLLTQPDNTLREEQQYLLAMQMLGLFMQGRDGEFMESYNQHTGRLFGSSALPFEIELLHKHVLARGK